MLSSAPGVSIWGVVVIDRGEAIRRMSCNLYQGQITKLLIAGNGAMPCWVGDRLEEGISLGVMGTGWDFLNKDSWWWIYIRKHKDVFVSSIILQHWDVAGIWNPSRILNPWFWTSPIRMFQFQHWEGKEIWKSISPGSHFTKGFWAHKCIKILLLLHKKWLTCNSTILHKLTFLY